MVFTATAMRVTADQLADKHSVFFAWVTNKREPQLFSVVEEPSIVDVDLLSSGLWLYFCCDGKAFGFKYNPICCNTFQVDKFCFCVMLLHVYHSQLHVCKLWCWGKSGQKVSYRVCIINSNRPKGGGCLITFAKHIPFLDTRKKWFSVSVPNLTDYKNRSLANAVCLTLSWPGFAF